VSNVLFLPASPLSPPSSLLSVDGRRVLTLKPGANDLRRLPAGVYFLCMAQAQAQAVRKIIVSR